MIHNKRILVVVPARGGSKGIRLKNIVPINGIPLVALVGRLVRQLDFIDRTVVSTDHSEIAEIAKGAGLDVPFYRPEELSGDFVSDLDVLTHALHLVEHIDRAIYDIVVMLQPTSPLRKAEHIRDTVNMLIEGGFDAVWTVSETDSKYHPLKQLSISNGKLEYYDPQGNQVIARQQLSTLYHRNGAAYAITRDCLLNQKNIMGDNTGAVIIHDPMISIDTEDDIRLAQLEYNKRF